MTGCKMRRNTRVPCNEIFLALKAVRSQPTMFVFSWAGIRKLKDACYELIARRALKVEFATQVGVGSESSGASYCTNV